MAGEPSSQPERPRRRPRKRIPAPVIFGPPFGFPMPVGRTSRFPAASSPARMPVASLPEALPMCGRYTLYSQPGAISAAFGVPEFSQTRLRFNIAPSQIVAAVRQSHGNHTRELVMLEWGQGREHR